VRIDLPGLSRKNTPMPENSQDANSKPVVVIRRRPVAKAAVAKPKPVATAKSVTAKQTTAKPATAMQAPRPVSPPPVAPTSKPAPKPPTLPEDPAVIAARQAARNEATRAVLTEIMARWPHTFTPHPVPVRPLARGMVQVIAAQLPAVSKTMVSQAIGFWQRQRKTPYLQAVIAGGPRYDLDGNPHGEVTPEEQERARTELVAWRASRQEKRRHAPQRYRPVTARDGRDNGTPQPLPQPQSNVLPEAEPQERVSEGTHEL
jgi:ProP effector